MLNYKRRKRQANENSKIIIERFSKEIDNRVNLYPGIYHIFTENDLMDIIKKVVKDVRFIAEKIEPNWSIPIILESIGQLYYGNQKKAINYGTTFKRALVYLWDLKTNNYSVKNIESILEVLRLCFVIENLYAYRRFFLIDDEFNFDLNNGYCCLCDRYRSMASEFADLIKGRGKRMRIADVNSRLMCNNIVEFSDALKDVLQGKKPKDVQLFKGTFYEKIPGINNVECKKFWQGIYIRYMMFLNASIDQVAEKEEEEAMNPTVTIFPEFIIYLPEELFTQEIVYDMFWNKKWLEGQDDENYGNLVVERPILRITEDGDFATCSVLLGDAINHFVEDQILDYTYRLPKINLPTHIFKDVISGPFEDMVINEFRKKGFLAGHVSENGVWMIQDRPIDLSHASKVKVYGEIDALAYMKELNMAILVECKVLNDIRDYKSFKNLITKIVYDNEGFQAKIEKKGKWVNEVLSDYYQTEVLTVCVLLTDISLPIVNFPNDNIIFTYYDKFFGGLEQILNIYKA